MYQLLWSKLCLFIIKLPYKDVWAVGSWILMILHHSSQGELVIWGCVFVFFSFECYDDSEFIARLQGPLQYWMVNECFSKTTQLIDQSNFLFVSLSDSLSKLNINCFYECHKKIRCEIRPIEKQDIWQVTNLRSWSCHIVNKSYSVTQLSMVTTNIIWFTCCFLLGLRMALELVLSLKKLDQNLTTGKIIFYIYKFCCIFSIDKIIIFSAVMFLTGCHVSLLKTYWSRTLTGCPPPRPCPSPLFPID